jgi:hypothetical protein
MISHRSRLEAGYRPPFASFRSRLPLPLLDRLEAGLVRLLRSGGQVRRLNGDLSWNIRNSAGGSPPLNDPGRIKADLAP